MRSMNAMRSVSVFVCCLVCLTACSGNDDDVRFAAAGEDDGGAGTPVEALSYAETPEFALWRQTDEGELVPLHGGEHLAGPVTLAVGISPCPPDVRVSFSDGGPEEVEARETDGLFTARVIFDEGRPRQALLVQAVRPDDLAAKQKWVFVTSPQPGPDVLVRDGVVLLVGDDLMDMAEAPMERMLNDMIAEKASESFRDVHLAIDNLGAPRDPDGEGILSVEFTATKPRRLPVDFRGELSVSDRDWKKQPQICFDVEDGDFTGFLVGLFSPFMVMDFPDVFSKLPADLADNIPYVSPEYLADLFSRHCYLDIYGLPAACTTDHLALGAGLFLTEGEEFDVPLHPETPWDADVLTPDESYNLSLSLSGDALNQLLAGMLRGPGGAGLCAVVDNPDIFAAIPYGDQLFGAHEAHRAFRMTLGQASLAVDLDGERPCIEAVDVRMEYVEDGTPRWEMSVDLSLALEVSSSLGEEGVMLTLAPELLGARTHILRDDSGISLMFDHSFFVQVLSNELLAEPFRINLSEKLGSKLTLRDAPRGPLVLESDDGRLNLQAAVEELNF